MILSIGEILYDIFPGYKRLGGAPLNFAFHVKQLGVPVCLVSRIGADAAGLSALQELRQIGFDTSHIQIDKQHRTGEVIVKIDQNGEPDFNIADNVAYDYINYKHMQHILKDETIDLIYFGSLIQRTGYGFETMKKVFASKSPNTKCLYDINLRPDCYSKAVIVESMRQADLLKINETEFQTIKQMLDGSRKSDAAFLDQLMNDYQIEMIALTRGSKGSEIITQDNHYTQQAPLHSKTVNSVGAGDAYTSIVAIGYLQGLPMEEILSAATDFAARICEIDSAFTTDPSFYDNWRSRHHEVNIG
ncbi:MAG: hypothetical protein C4522_17040 [Desulfobacteraceae bacterium]|nr:MAG: hypothetical protein C4522_17040 [Desulfobacteraceae bacterium]